MTLVEDLPLVLSLIFIGGLSQPIVALILGGWYFVATIICIIVFMKAHNASVRFWVSRSMVFTKWALFGLSLYTASTYMKIYHDSSLLNQSYSLTSSYQS